MTITERGRRSVCIFLKIPVYIMYTIYRERKKEVYTHKSTSKVHKKYVLTPYISKMQSLHSVCFVIFIMCAVQLFFHTQRRKNLAHPLPLAISFFQTSIKNKRLFSQNREEKTIMATEQISVKLSYIL